MDWILFAFVVAYGIFSPHHTRPPDRFVNDGFALWRMKTKKPIFRSLYQHLLFLLFSILTLGVLFTPSCVASAATREIHHSFKLSQETSVQKYLASLRKLFRDEQEKTKKREMELEEFAAKATPRQTNFDDLPRAEAFFCALTATTDSESLPSTIDFEDEGFLVVTDNSATKTLTPFLSDLHNAQMQNGVVDGVSKADIQAVGTVRWMMLDDEDVPNLFVDNEAYYVPTAPHRIMSVSSVGIQRSASRQDGQQDNVHVDTNADQQTSYLHWDQD